MLYQWTWDDGSDNQRRVGCHSGFNANACGAGAWLEVIQKTLRILRRADPAQSESNEEGPSPILVSLLHAHWTSVVQHWDDKIKSSSFISSSSSSATSQASWHVCHFQGCVESPNSNSCVPAVQKDGPDGVSKIAASVTFISFRFMAAM
jgi:hypothetical protein